MNVLRNFLHVANIQGGTFRGILGKKAITIRVQNDENRPPIGGLTMESTIPRPGGSRRRDLVDRDCLGQTPVTERIIPFLRDQEIRESSYQYLPYRRRRPSFLPFHQ